MIQIVDEFFNSGLEQDAVYMAASLSSLSLRTIPVIFDSPFDVAKINNMTIDASRPQVTCKSTDVANVNQNDILTISGVVYRVISIQPDGDGFTTLILGYD